jgi:hypothetical protein
MSTSSVELLAMILWSRIESLVVEEKLIFDSEATEHLGGVQTPLTINQPGWIKLHLFIFVHAPAHRRAVEVNPVRASAIASTRL